MCFLYTVSTTITFHFPHYETVPSSCNTSFLCWVLFVSDHYWRYKEWRVPLICPIDIYPKRSFLWMSYCRYSSQSELVFSSQAFEMNIFNEKGHSQITSLPCAPVWYRDILSETLWPSSVKSPNKSWDSILSTTHYFFNSLKRVVQLPKTACSLLISLRFSSWSFLMFVFLYRQHHLCFLLLRQRVRVSALDITMLFVGFLGLLLGSPHFLFLTKGLFSLQCMGSSSKSRINTFTFIPSCSLQTPWQDMVYAPFALGTKCCLPRASKPLHHPLIASTTTEKWDEGHICMSILV